MDEIAVFTMGTRGDIQPYIYLAQALMSYGVRVIIGSHPCWRELTEQSGVLFAPIGPDVNMEEEAAKIRGKTKNPALSMLRTMNFVFRIIQNSSEDIYRVCRGKKLIIVSHSQMGAVEAEALGIRTVNVTLQTEMIPEKLKNKTWKERITGNFINAQMVRPYNKIRKKYQLSPIKSADEIMSKELDLIPISRYAVRQNPYWEPHHRLMGYWYPEETEYKPSEALKIFLEAGEQPVILALGAMSFESGKEEEKLEVFLKAFQNMGLRAVIQGFQKTLAEYVLPDTMIAVGSVPHSWLFRQGYCVIHHCGFGTAAASMIYGIPSIPVPHVLDQFGFAKQLYDLGVAAEPVKAGNLSIGTVEKALREMKETYGEKKRRAVELSEKLLAENGLKRSAELVMQILDGPAASGGGKA